MAQLIPTDDDFDVNSGADAEHFGDIHAGYLNYEVTFNGESSELGWLHDGYADDVTEPNGGLAVCSTPDINFGDPPGSALLVRRETFQENQSSYASFSFFNTTGIYNPTKWGRNGVAARVQDTSASLSLTGDGDTLTYRAEADHNCYLLYVQTFSVQSLIFTISRIDGGSETILSTESPSFVAYPSNLKTAELELLCITSGGSVLIGGRYNGTLVISAIDSSASRITGAGRCGVLVRGEQPSGTPHMTGLTAFGVKDQDIVGNPYLFKDEFYRASNFGWTVTDRHGIEGRLLTSDYNFDRYSSAYQTLLVTNGDERSALHANGASSPNTVGVDGEASGNSAYAWAFRSVPVQDIRNQHRELKITHSGDYGAAAGVVLRGYFKPGPIDSVVIQTPNGYRADARCLSGPALSVRLYRLSPGDPGNALLLGQNDAVDTIDLGTEFTIDFEVHGFDGPDPDAGAVMVVKINGTEVTWDTTQVDDDNIEFLADGTVIDYSTSRITSGPMEGIFLTAEVDTPQRDIEVRDFNQNALFALTSPGFDSYTDIDVDAESANATGTLTLDVTWPCERLEHMRSDAADVISGKTRRVAFSEHTRSSWRVTAIGLETDASQDLIDFFNTHNGNEVPFTWTPPGDFSTSGIYKFREDAITRIQVAPGIWGFQLIIDPMES